MFENINYIEKREKERKDQDEIRKMSFWWKFSWFLIITNGSSVEGTSSSFEWCMMDSLGVSRYLFRNLISFIYFFIFIEISFLNHRQRWFRWLWWWWWRWWRTESRWWLRWCCLRLRWWCRCWWWFVNKYHIGIDKTSDHWDIQADKIDSRKDIIATDIHSDEGH